MCVYNEADVIVPSINHLIDQGIELYLLDNCSTDDTYDLALNFKGRGLLGIERFPSQGPSHYFDLRRLLQRKEELATQITADWFIHHDADEIRSSPWSGISLKDGIYRVDQAGYNCIDHTVLSFPPLDNDYPPGTDPEAYFKQFEFDTHPGNDVRLNAWKNLGQKVSLAKSAGHEVRFSGRRVYPYKFLLKHYPIRSQSHGERKVLVERQARWEPAARAAGWHRQYDQIVKTTNFLRRSSDLDLFEEHYFNSFYLVERLAGTGLSANPAGMKRRDAWLTGLHNVTRDILAVIPMSDIFLLVDEDQLRSKLPGSLRPVPFLERNGEYWGPPADDGTAIREIERLRRAGSKFVAFAWPAFWWLDFYSGFHRYLCSKYRCVLENDRLVVFDLRTVTGRDSTG
jgi:glycosyltransferase involved in cell wall biosynthesis